LLIAGKKNIRMIWPVSLIPAQIKNKEKQNPNGFIWLFREYIICHAIGSDSVTDYAWEIDSQRIEKA